MTTGATDLDTGTYEVLRDRLTARAAELARRAEALNARRAEAFGAAGLELTGTRPLRTEHLCAPRDIVAVGDCLLFGHNTVAGAKAETVVADVLTLYDRDLNRRPADAVPGLLDDPAFVREFAALHRYYRQARLLRLHRVDGRLLAVFQTGETVHDVRVLRWALSDDGQVSFLDARGERDHVTPAAHDFSWTVTTRADHVLGRHPHVSVEGEVFVATVAGALTVKAEDDTNSGEGVHSEPVAEPLQSLADADIAYARVGALILLRVLPYKEDAHRYLVFNTLTRTVVRLDGIGRACRRLPANQGVVFPGGYCLADGTHRTFDGVDTGDLEFERVVRPPEGDEVLFAFRAHAAGRSLLLPYDTIRKEVATPLPCQGWDLFDDGALFLLRSGGAEQQRLHPLQLWSSPYVSDTHAAGRHVGDGPLARVGNVDLVRGVSDCLSIAGSVAGTTPTSEVYGALAAACVRAAESHHWLGDAELGDLLEPLEQVRHTAEQVLAEFRAVRALTRQAADALAETAEHVSAVVRRLRGDVPRGVTVWVSGLTELRQAQGHLLTLKDMRYADTAGIDELAADVESDLASFGRRAVAHLADEHAFTDLHTDVERLLADATGIARVAEAAPVAARIGELADGLHAVTEVVASLDIGDATVRTSVLERVAEVLGGVNRARAVLDGRRRELLDLEGRAEFAAEFSLLGQTVTGALASADTPEKCDEQLARVLLRLENLEARFVHFDDFLTELADKRDEIHEAFAVRKQNLMDIRARRAERLAESAARVLATVTHRAATLADADAVATYFSSDAMPAEARRLADELRQLGDRVRADELDDRIRAARQEAVRALRDRSDLYADDGRTLRLGTHRFAVNTQPLDIALVPHGDTLAFALTGTDHRSPITDPDFASTRPYWDRPLPSESPEVYRAEHLAARLLDEHGPAALAEADLPALVRRAAQEAYDEGYVRGVHDHDTVLILSALLRLHATAGRLRHEPSARARAVLMWTHGTTPETRTRWSRRAVSLARARDTFGPVAAIADLQAELAEAIGGPGAQAAAAYLFDELTTGPGGFVIGSTTRTLLEKFRRTLDTPAYADDLAALDDLDARRQLVDAWLSSYAVSTGTHVTAGDLAEAVAAELCPDLPRYASDAPLTETVGGLLGTHPRLTGGSLTIRVDELLARTGAFRLEQVPAHRAYQRRRAALTSAERTRLRLDEYRPRTMSTFVRNRLVDEVYLPLVGDSLAKQLGTTGGTGRTDTGGLLLLISPPGYGKTSLMEYVADRLGLMLVRVSGPALGRAVTSLDPAEAPNTTARQEVEKINFALAAGNNTLLYLDDIQHTSPELMQTFIPLCDTTRRIDGVRDRRPHTYDLRGKRFAVCMAGNPHTESGGRFHVPDMLANRADVWNLGDVLAGKEQVFALSFVENALTANPVLAPLAGRDRADLDLFLRLAEGDPTARADRLVHPWSPAERTRIVAVLSHLLTIRATVLAVNAAYIASAAQSDASRTEPPFRLQGSYRTMNRIAQRVRPVMNDTEVSALIDDHYAAQAQTLTTGAEANLLKLAELRGTLSAEQAARWSEVKARYVRAQALGGPEHDQFTRAVAALGLLADRVGAVESAINRAADPRHLVADPSARHPERRP
ncbi:DNA repair ATPase [Streptomyces sp. AS58]|uniref:DNA repair ATPase n=1 Tax=Streptomyces sp. AS58 TaxID=1519489 RepID=UPI0006ADCC38|nr:DNA repair ATPase [Streptomyces sp. AS58]KOV69898.1 DNA repair ATPase [Streptomyces sp. AS58]